MEGSQKDCQEKYQAALAFAQLDRSFENDWPSNLHQALLDFWRLEQCFSCDWVILKLSSLCEGG